MVIDLDARAGIVVEACQLEVIADTWCTAYGHQHLLGLNALFLPLLVGEGNLLASYSRHGALQVEGDTAFFKYLAQSLGDVAV